VVARIVSLRPPTRDLTRDACATAGTRWEAPAPTLSPAESGDGRRTDEEALDGPRGTGSAAPAGADGRWVRAKKRWPAGPQRSPTRAGAGWLGHMWVVAGTVCV
jgi:hypothetical protein